MLHCLRKVISLQSEWCSVQYYWYIMTEESCSSYLMTPRTCISVLYFLHMSLLFSTISKAFFVLYYSATQTCRSFTTSLSLFTKAPFYRVFVILFLYLPLNFSPVSYFISISTIGSKYLFIIIFLKHFKYNSVSRFDNFRF